MDYMAYDLIVIGAGAGGLFAGACLPRSVRGLVLEKGPSPGAKLLLTGSGQCNLTRTGDIKGFLPHYGHNKEKFIRTVLYPFNNSAVMNFFEGCGLSLLCREDGKVFPRSLSARDVLNTLVTACKKNGMEFRFSAGVTSIQPTEKREGEYAFLVQTPSETFFSKKVICAVGGCSYPSTGSDGSFFDTFRTLGLEVVPVTPALTPIFVQNYPYVALSGISLSDVELQLQSAPPARGDLLFTHKGFSGPLILNHSRYARTGLNLTLNYFPPQNGVGLLARWKGGIHGNGKQLISFLQDELPSLPRRLLETLCLRLSLDPSAKVSRISIADLKSLAEKITRDEFSISGLGGYSVSMATAGGVSLSEVNPKTMEVTRYPGLYIIGEALDVDGDTGGYNLQFAFSSARQAAVHIYNHR